MKDYEAYFESKNDIKIGEEMEVQLRDRDTFEEINVKAIISDKKEGFDRALKVKITQSFDKIQKNVLSYFFGYVIIF